MKHTSTPPVESLRPCRSGPASQQGKSRRVISGEINFSGTASGVQTEIGGLFPDLKYQPVTLARVCLRCGADFDQEKPLGRPQRYCSAECRGIERRKMVATWKLHNEIKSQTQRTCRNCGGVFSLPPRQQGRLPHWCSPQCKRATLSGNSPGPSPDGDLFTCLSQKGTFND